MADTSAPVIPGAEFDVTEHGYDMPSMLSVAVMFGVRIPRLWVGPRCLAAHPAGWACTRAAGHKRRHHATFPSGDDAGDLVLAVWHQHDY